MSLDPSEYFESLPRRRVGAGALLLDVTGNVLMVEPVYKDHWEISGGIVENGEGPRQACERECLEELGLRLEIGRLLVLEHQTHEPPRRVRFALLALQEGSTIELTNGVRAT